MSKCDCGEIKNAKDKMCNECLAIQKRNSLSSIKHAHGRGLIKPKKKKLKGLSCIKTTKSKISFGTLPWLRTI